MTITPPTPPAPRGALPWNRYLHELLGHRISRIGRYADRVQHVSPLEGDPGYLFEALEAKHKERCSIEPLESDARTDTNERVLLLVNGNLNHCEDLDAFLSTMRSTMGPDSTAALIVYNSYYRFLYQILGVLGLRTAEIPQTFLTAHQVKELCRVADLEVVSHEKACYVPARLCGLGNALNALLPLVPLVRHLSLAEIFLVRAAAPRSEPSCVSVLVPARNERGNIRPLLERIPSLAKDTEIIFIEGGSTDGTWDEIQRATAEYTGPIRIQTVQQTGKGKADAVRLGCSRASGDLLVILDADLSVRPEELPKFVAAYVSGKGDFVNGNRLLYPMRTGAMNFLNLLGNVFFAKLLSFLLRVSIGDSLCGTKVYAARDYTRFRAWATRYMPDDPFGDFELLCPAAELGLRIVDVPIRYEARTYGQTNIRRFAHGFQLLKLVFSYAAGRYLRGR